MKVKERPVPAVLADMVDGVVVANRLTGESAAELREVLWIAVADLASPDATGSSRGAEVREIRAA